MDRRQMLKRVFLLLAPVAASALFLLIFGWSLPAEVRRIFAVLLLSYFISPFGREVLIPMTMIALVEVHGTSHMFSDMALIIISILFIDVMCSIFVLWNLDLFRHVPKLGRLIEGVERYGREGLRRNRKRRHSVFLGLTLYMMIPFQGTNGTMSSIIGMLSGMRKARIWFVVWIGSILGSLAIALISFTVGQEFLIDTFGNSSWKGVSALLTLGILSYIGLSYYRHRQRKLLPT